MGGGGGGGGGGGRVCVCREGGVARGCPPNQLDVGASVMRKGEESAHSYHHTARGGGGYAEVPAAAAVCTIQWGRQGLHER